RGQAGRQTFQRFGNHAGGHFTGGMTARAVRDCPDTKVGAIHERILIVLPLGPGMRHGPGPDPCRIHQRSSVAAAADSSLFIVPLAAAVSWPAPSMPAKPVESGKVPRVN